MRGAGERLERLVATKQQIDPVECSRVVAMGAAGWEDRREVDDVRAESLDVVEVGFHAAEVAAEPLVRSLRPPARRRLIPGTRKRDVQRLV